MTLQINVGSVRLREATPADIDVLVALMPDDFDHDPTFPLVAGRGLEAHREAWVRAWLADFLAASSRTPRPWVFVVDDEGKPVGLQTLEATDEPGHYDSTSFLTPSARGKGLGVAMRTAVLALAFDRLDATRCTSAARPDNVASHKVTERVGYRFVGRTSPVVAGNLRPIDVYEMTRAMWETLDHLPVEFS